MELKLINNFKHCTAYKTCVNFVKIFYLKLVPIWDGILFVNPDVIVDFDWPLTLAMARDLKLVLYNACHV